MNATHIHLLLNHFPIIGLLVATMLLIWAVVRKNVSLQKTASVIIILMALIAIPVFLTGEPAEESVENLPGVSEQIIEEHEDAAKFALILMELTAVTAVGALAIAKNKEAVAQKLLYGVAVLSVVTCVAMARTGYLGGQIRHTEIRTGVNQAPGKQQGENGTAPQQENGKENGKDDDDDDNK